MVLLNLRVLLSSKNRIEGLNILRTVVVSLRGEPGFVRFNLYQDVDNENAITFEEVWNNQDDLDRRVRSESYRPILVLMALSCEPPEINFQTVSAGSGMERIKSIREEVIEY